MYALYGPPAVTRMMVGWLERHKGGKVAGATLGLSFMAQALGFRDLGI